MRASNPDYPPIGIGGRHIAGKLDPTFPRLFAIARNCWLLKRQGQLRLSFAAALVGSEFQIAGVAELADALDSKSSGRKAVWVRAPPPAIFHSAGHWTFDV